MFIITATGLLDRRRFYINPEGFFSMFRYQAGVYPVLPAETVARLMTQYPGYAFAIERLNRNSRPAN